MIHGTPGHQIVIINFSIDVPLTSYLAHTYYMYQQYHRARAAEHAHVYWVR